MNLNSVFFTDAKNGWATGINGMILHTSNGGTTWEAQDSGTYLPLYVVRFSDSRTGFIFGMFGVFLHTTNGGTTWTIEAEGLTTEPLSRVHFTSPTNGYVVGNGKTLLKYGEILNSVEEIESIQFEIYPNPAKNRIKLLSSELITNNCKIELHDLYGKTLIEKQIPAGIKNIEIDVSNLASGVYFCTMKKDKKSSTKKLIIE